MNEEQVPQQNVSQQSVSSEPIQPPAQNQPAAKEADPTIKLVERITAWTMILSAIFFALISLMAIWGIFGDNAGDIVWKSLTSLGVIAFTALIINVAARTIEGRKK